MFVTMFFLLLLEDERDTAIVNQDACKACTEKKIGCKVYRSFRLDKKDFKELRKLDAKGYKVKCEENCSDFELIKEF